MSILSEASRNLVNLSRSSKILIAILIDIGLCILSTWFAFYLRLEQFIKINDITILAVLISIFLAIPIFWLSGLYKTMFRFAGLSIVFTVAVAIFAYSLIYFGFIGIYGFDGIPRSIGIIQPLLLFLTMSTSRLVVRYLIIGNFKLKKTKNKKKTLIYGAGSAGRQILTNLENNSEIKVIGFLDDDKQYHNRTVLGQIVYNPSKINEIISIKNVDQVLLALPSINRQKRNKIIDNLNKYKLIVKTLPRFQDIVDGKISISDIKDLNIDDLLNREQIQPNSVLLNKNINSKIVLVTGAGGSIGSELCLQIIKLKPKKLILVELNEFALYKITEKLKKIKPTIKIISLLINIQNSSRLDEVFKNFDVDTVYHAAAYKHVSLVEENICESVKNNVLGTLLVAEIATKYNVANFVLISSDKAVRATNIMGASKRLAEICVQSIYHHRKNKSKFSIVRFGNVLESSGSVIPKFKAQIREGGPVTLTHPEVNRYFMTITEAAQLVIQAGAMSENCEVFILDMGESIKIKDLIYKMINLSGLTVKDENNIEGDIEIKITGLRPGEKLYEELLIGDNPQKTYHKKIKKALDPFISFVELKPDLENLSKLIEENRARDVKELLGKIIPSYHSNSKIVDQIHKEQLKFIKGKKILVESDTNEDKIIKIRT